MRVLCKLKKEVRINETYDQALSYIAKRSKIEAIEDFYGEWHFMYVMLKTAIYDAIFLKGTKEGRSATWWLQTREEMEGECVTFDNVCEWIGIGSVKLRTKLRELGVI